MKTMTIMIPDMQSLHCQARVNSAVSAIGGAQVKKSEAGKLSLLLEKESPAGEVISAIEKAGYRAEPES